MNLVLALLGLGALALLGVLVPWLEFVLTLALAKSLAVLGVMLLLRAGQVSFGQGLYVAIGAYAVAFLAPVWPDALVLAAAGTLAAAAAGAVIGLLVARYRDIFFGMLNLAVSMVAYAVLEKFYTLTHGSDGLRVPALAFGGLAPGREVMEHAVFATCLLAVLACGGLCAAYLRAPLGAGLVAVKTREPRLEFAGVSGRQTLWCAYVLAAALAGLGGALLAVATRHVTPQLAYWTSSGELVFIAILGGAGSVPGAALGAVAYELVRVNAAALVADLWQAILGLVLLAVILFAPGGLWGALRQVLPGQRPA
jgi:branched-chain amino acid transport system permease protein